MSLRFHTMLTIAGLDPTGGAGIAADIKTASSLGVYAMSVATSVTCQTPSAYIGAQDIDPKMVGEQISAVLSNFATDVIKSGMIPSRETAAVISDVLSAYPRRPYVLDPVAVSTTGGIMANEETMEGIKTLFPLATLVTPNVRETKMITGIDYSHDTSCLESAFISFKDMGAESVLFKGGDSDNNRYSVDYLFESDGTVTKFENERVDTKNLHGTGCTLSSAIACYLGMGETLKDSVEKGLEFVHNAIVSAANISQTHTYGPLCHGFNPQKMAPFSDESPFGEYAELVSVF